MSDSEVDFEDFSEADGSFADFDEELDHFEDTQFRNGKGKETPKVLDNQQIIEKQLEETKEVASILSISIAEAQKLCQKFNWNREALFDDHFKKQDTNALIRKISSQGGFESEMSVDLSTTMNCIICSDDFELSNFYKISSCDKTHMFCMGCWREHATVKIREGEHIIHCMGHKCPSEFNDSRILQQILEPKTYELYEYICAKNYIRTHRQARWCPNPNCKKAIFSSSDVTTAQNVTCECGCKFCFSCGNQCHTPIDCELLRMWEEKLSNEGQNMDWMKCFTKPCPHKDCGRPIQKDGGCDFMKCQACKGFFCWKCLSVLQTDHQGHPCRVVEKADSHIIEKKRGELQDFSKCFSGFQLYLNRNPIYQKSRSLLEIKQQNYNYLVHQTHMPLEFYIEALNAVIEAEQTMKFSYVFQYFTRDDPKDLLLFSYNQTNFKEALDALLTHLNLEEVLKTDKEQIEGKTKTLRIRQETLHRAIEEGLTTNSDLYIIGSSSRSQGQ